MVRTRSYFYHSEQGHIALFDTIGSGELEFPEFCTLAAQFLIEEDTEQMHNELREAFRLYDKEGSSCSRLPSLAE